MKAGANFQQRADSAAQFAVTFGWVGHAREDFKQGAFSSPITPDDPDCLTLFDVKTDIAQRPDFFFFASAIAFSEEVPDFLSLTYDKIAQCILAFLESANVIALANAPDDD
jgi:hypothetical protein